MIPEESEENQNKETVSEVSETDEIEALKKALTEEKEKSENYLANWQRAQADFINYKRRTEEERGETIRCANSDLICSLLPAVDDLERALASIPPNLEKESWLDGIRLIERKLGACMEAQGLTPIKALGESFDPNIHEALRQDEGQEGIVLEEIQKGYKLSDRVIRPSKVVVGNGEVAEKEDK